MLKKSIHSLVSIVIHVNATFTLRNFQEKVSAICGGFEGLRVWTSFSTFATLF